MSRKCVFHSTVLYFFATVFACMPVLGQKQNVIERAEALMGEGKFYEALFSLEPLLVSDDKNHRQADALWLANALCKTLIRDGRIYQKFRETRDPGQALDRYFTDDEYMQWDVIQTLNEWGAKIDFCHLGGEYDYRYGFLERLVALYPDDSRCPAAEYYLIAWGYNERNTVEASLAARYAYVEKYAKTGLSEVYMAYLDIAHISDNLW